MKKTSKTQMGLPQNRSSLKKQNDLSFQRQWDSEMPVLVENLLVMILTVVVLIAGVWVFLLILQMLLKFKTGHREDEGLTDLWQTVITKPEQNENDADSGVT